jgi:hypothetical protein
VQPTTGAPPPDDNRLNDPIELLEIPCDNGDSEVDHDDNWQNDPPGLLEIPYDDGDSEVDPDNNRQNDPPGLLEIPCDDGDSEIDPRMNRAVEIYREVFCAGPHFTDSMAMWCAGLPEDMVTRADYKAEFDELLQLYNESYGHRNFGHDKQEKIERFTKLWQLIVVNTLPSLPFISIKAKKKEKRRVSYAAGGL